MSKYLPYLYLGRVPLLTALLLVALAPLSLFSGLQTLLRGLFDLKPWGIFFVAMGSLLGAWTLMITWWIVAAYGHLRFGVAPTGVEFPPSRKATVLFALLAVPLWLGALYESVFSFTLVLGLAAGIAAAAFVLWAVNKISKLPYLQRKTLGKRRKLGAGYHENGDILRGHGLAVSMFVAAVLVYLGVGLLKFLLPGEGEQGATPSLAYVLLLAMVSCWGLAGTAFFVDLYRVPVIIPLGLWWILTSQVFPSDHYYLVFPGSRPTTPPAELIQKGKTRRVIVVATTGGGIQAAAWTAKVLEGLEQKCRESASKACHDDPKIFGKSVRLISSVSGGSTGTMYVVNEYDPNGGGLPDTLGTAYKESTRSSLDDVAWGLVYPDFFRTLMPFPFRFDRGWALEQAWRGNTSKGQPDIAGGFAWWRDGANSGTIPGLLFNSTITELGDRLLLNTAGVAPGAASKTFNDLGDKPGFYKDKDLAIATAARLSASFTYVTPVARSDGDRSHMADGGYYDNYGMSTLIQWLRQGLPQGSPVKEVMVVQIRAFPPDAQPAQPSRGWLYQAIAPLDVMLSVRTAGQYAHNHDEFALLQQAQSAAGVNIYTSVFEFCQANAPLSWHLEARDITKLNNDWDTAEIQREWLKVERFLNGQSAPADVPEPPLSAFCQ